jgi:hypothetical protein
MAQIFCVSVICPKTIGCPPGLTEVGWNVFVVVSLMPEAGW